MSMGREDLELLSASFVEAENKIRNANPVFQGGFCTITMHAARLQGTVDRLKLHRRQFRDMTKQMTNKLKSWRKAHPGQVVRGESNSIPHRREYINNYRNGKKRGPGARITKKPLSPKSHLVKLEFEARDYEMRNQLEGLAVLDGILEDCEAVLSLRVKACYTLEKIGKKWNSGTFEAEDGGKLALAYEEVVDGSLELKEINEMLDILPEKL